CRDAAQCFIHLRQVPLECRLLPFQRLPAGDEVEDCLLLLVDLKFAEVLLAAQRAVTLQRLPGQRLLPLADRELAAQPVELATECCTLLSKACLSRVQQFAMRSGGGQYARAPALDAFGDAVARVAAALGGARSGDQRQRRARQHPFALAREDAIHDARPRGHHRGHAQVRHQLALYARASGVFAHGQVDADRDRCCRDARCKDPQSQRLGKRDPTQPAFAPGLDHLGAEQRFAHDQAGTACGSAAPSTLGRAAARGLISRTIRPASISRTRSALAIVSGRWAMITLVMRSARTASLTSFSQATSRWLVASSRNRMRGWR